MKKLLVIIAASAFIFSCSSKEEETTTEGTKNEAGVQNVNGNIPDTTNSIDLSTSKDSASADSIRR